MGTKEEIEDLQERQRQLQEFLGELDMNLCEQCQEEEEEVDESILKEVDDAIEEDQKNEAQKKIEELPDVPINLNEIPLSVDTIDNACLVEDEQCPYLCLFSRNVIFNCIVK